VDGVKKFLGLIKRSAPDGIATAFSVPIRYSPKIEERHTSIFDPKAMKYKEKMVDAEGFEPTTR
jgi:hypothetical protein